MTQPLQDLNRVHDFYTAPRPTGHGSRSIYEIWEHAGAFNDSITPSTYVPAYRAHIVRKILSATFLDGTVFSLGCGNGFVEAELLRYARTVLAMDCNQEAVELTKKKGVTAFVADFFLLRPEDVATTDLIYADGLLGHLFHPKDKMEPALRKLKSLNLRSGTRLVLSNDAPEDRRVPFARHESVDAFWFISKHYLRERLSHIGFEPLESYYFPYMRPISGLRRRTICVARVP